jgi:N-formylglutamate deformylase
MGVIYTKAEDGRRLRKEPTNKERQELLDRFYHPHHKKVSDLVQNALLEKGTCLIIDCHSFPSRPFLYEQKSNVKRPDICIGTDEYHTPKPLTDKLVQYFENVGLRVAINHPYRGSFVPLQFYHSNPNVRSIMIEVNRALYMNEETGEENKDFPEIQKLIENAINNSNDFNKTT